MTGGEHEQEQQLTGGNVSEVFKVGATVRRVQTENSTRIQRLLKHLEHKGFRYAPKFIGVDKTNREVLSFIEGEAGNDPAKGYMWSDDSLAQIAQMLRAYHDAVADFPFDNMWKPLDNTPKPYELICHNDFALYNLIFDNEKVAGIIDFDVAAPGPRIWDIAYTLYTCIPLSRLYYGEDGQAIHYDSSTDDVLKKKRIALFFDVYGESIPEQLREIVEQRLEGLCMTIKRLAAEGNIAFQTMIEEGHVTHYEKDIAFIHEHSSKWI